MKPFCHSYCNKKARGLQRQTARKAALGPHCFCTVKRRMRRRESTGEPPVNIVSKRLRFQRPHGRRSLGLPGLGAYRAASTSSVSRAKASSSRYSPLPYSPFASSHSCIVTNLRLSSACAINESDMRARTTASASVMVSSLMVNSFRFARWQGMVSAVLCYPSRVTEKPSQSYGVHVFSWSVIFAPVGASVRLSSAFSASHSGSKVS